MSAPEMSRMGGKTVCGRVATVQQAPIRAAIARYL